MYRVLVLTSPSRTASSARTRLYSSEVRCARRYAPRRQASANVRASRRSVFTRLLRVAYIGAKFGSATITSWPSSSRHLAPTRSPSTPRSALGPSALSQHPCKSLSIRLDPPFLEDLCVLP